VGVGLCGDCPALGGDFDGFSGAVGQVEGDGVGLRLEAEGGETVADGPGGSGAVETGAGGEGAADGVEVGIAGKLLEIAEVVEAEPVEQKGVVEGDAGVAAVAAGEADEEMAGGGRDGDGGGGVFVEQIAEFRVGRWAGGGLFGMEVRRSHSSFRIARGGAGRWGLEWGSC
jgi:hypothetical protein